MTKDKTLYLIFIIIILMLLILPHIVVSDYVSPTTTSKFIVFSYFSLGLLLFLIIKTIVSRVKKCEISKLDFAFAFFVIYMSVNRYIIQEEFGFSVKYMELLGLSILYIALRGIHYRYFNWFFLTVISSGIIQAVYGNLQLLGYLQSYHSKFNITGSFFNPGPYAGFLVCTWSLSLGMYLFKEVVIHQVYTGFNISSKIKKRLIKRLFTIVPLLGVLSTSLVIPATRSRAALLALVIAGFALLAIKYRNYLKLLKNSSKPKKYLSLLFFTIICSAIFFKGYQYKQASANGRLLIWKISKNIIVDSPFFGVGFDNFKAHYMNYQANYFSENKNSAEIAIAGNSKYAFNEFVQVTVENGIIGFAVFLFLVYLIFSLKLKHNQLFLGYLTRALILTIGVFALWDKSILRFYLKVLC